MNKTKDVIIVAGNWKMNKTPLESCSFIENLGPKINQLSCKPIIFAPYLGLESSMKISKDYNLDIGAQNFYFESHGAYTGEISADMLKSIGVGISLVGHSERRKFFNETNYSINQKIKKAIHLGISVVLCVGESLEDRLKNKYKETIEDQVNQALDGISHESLSKISVAYEPLWAIGSGETATPQQANEMCSFINKCIGNTYDLNLESSLKLLYGGSITQENCKEIFYMPDINGVLVGGASLEYKQFYGILKVADDIMKGNML